MIHSSLERMEVWAGNSKIRFNLENKLKHLGRRKSSEPQILVGGRNLANEILKNLGTLSVRKRSNSFPFQPLTKCLYMQLKM